MVMEYRLVSVLGAGAFGITYLARDTNLEKDLAIKEYLPAGIAIRAPNGSVVPVTHHQENDFRWGLERFIQETRTLAGFSHAHIVRVNRFFEANGTAYMVMDYEDGESLKAFLQRRGFLPEPALKALLAPLLHGVEKVHAAGFLHRDIKPDNILVRKDGGVVLIDFGSARHAVSGTNQGLTTIVSPGYAPFEQYTTTNEQGPWSDIYALGGVLYFAVTGQSPPDALARMKADALESGLHAARQRYSAPLIDAIGWALALDEAARPRSVAEWRGALLSTSGCAVPGTRAADRSTVRTMPADRVSSIQADAPTVRLDAVGSETSTGSATMLRHREPAKPSAHRATVRDWAWTVRYVAVALVALVLAASLGSMDLFQSTAIIRRQLTASHIVRFIGYGGALVILWLFAARAGAQIRDHGGRAAFLHQLVIPLVTLVVVPCAYGVLLLVLRPFIDGTLQSIYNWVFVLGIIAAAGWFALSLFQQSESLSASAKEAVARVQGAASVRSRNCPSCGSANVARAKFCDQCGNALVDPAG